MKMQCSHHMHIKLEKEKERKGGGDRASLLSEKKLLHSFLKIKDKVFLPLPIKINIVQ